MTFINELRNSFRGCVDPQWRITKEYFPEIMIERVWDIPNAEMNAAYANENFLSETAIDPRRFEDANAIFQAIVTGIQNDLKEMLRNQQNANGQKMYPFSSARALIYNIWISNDNRDSQEQIRIHVTEIEDPLPRIRWNIEESFQITKEDKAIIMTLIGMCAPWFDKSSTPQLELFAA